ncbi:MAG: GIY-YIG nuclease family protein [Bacteroidales bacterium]|nr:GIY-YIG nuclease family protein [Bacteroidales bacterium]
MAFHTYILYSNSQKKYYIGSTSNLKNRLRDHNSGRSRYTSRGKPWDLIYSKEFTTHREALQLENKIKKRGARRFLHGINED